MKKGIFYSFLTQVTTSVLSIITGILLSRFLGPEGRGLITLLQTDATFLLFLFGMSFPTAITYFISNKQIDPEKIVGSMIILLTVSSLVVGLTLFLIQSTTFSDFFNLELNIGGAYLLLFFFYFFGLGNILLQSFFEGFSEFKVINRIIVLTAISNLFFIGSIYLLLSFLSDEQKIHVAGFALIVSSIIVFGLWIIYYSKKLKIKINFNVTSNEIKHILGFSGIAYLCNLLNYLNYRFDFWIVQRYFGNYDLGIYSLSVNLSQSLWLIITPISLVLFPKFNGQSLDKEEKRRIFLLSLKLVMMVIFFSQVATFIFSGFLVPLVYGGEFMNSVLPLKILVCGILFSCLSKLIAMYFVTSGEVKINLKATVIGLIFTIPLDLILIPKLGLVGASLATSITYLAILSSQMMFGRKVLQIKLSQVLTFNSSEIEIQKSAWNQLR